MVLVFPFMLKPSLAAKSSKPIASRAVTLPACSFTNQIPAANLLKKIQYGIYLETYICHSAYFIKQ